MPKLIYSGQPIRTTLAFDDTIFDGVFIHALPSGGIAATLIDVTTHGYDPFGINLNDDEWELAEPSPGLHEDQYERGLFDD